jgi:hypothetical protein
MSDIRKWTKHDFSNSNSIGIKEFMQEFKAVIEYKASRADAELISFTVFGNGAQGLIKKVDHLVFFCIPDVKIFTNEWLTKVQIHTMKHPKDVVGGKYHYCALDNFALSVQMLFEEMEIVHEKR